MPRWRGTVFKYSGDSHSYIPLTALFFLAFFCFAKTAIGVDLSNCVGNLFGSNVVYNLISDMTIDVPPFWPICTSGFTCFCIQGNNVTVDCHGHKITGSAYCGSACEGIGASGNNITIKNCEINSIAWNVYHGDKYYVSNMSGSTSYVFGTTNTTVNNMRSGVSINAGSGNYTNLFGGVGILDASYNRIDNVTGSVSISGGRFNIISNVIGEYLQVYGSFTIQNNTFVNFTLGNRPAYSGVFLWNGQMNTFENFIIRNVTSGITVEEANDNIFRNFIIRNCTRGVYITYIGSQRVNFYNNQVHCNYGIYVDNVYSMQQWKVYNNLFNDSIWVYLPGTMSNYFNTTRQSGARIYSRGPEIGGNYYTNATGNGYSDICNDTERDGFCDQLLWINYGYSGDLLPLSNKYSSPTCAPCNYSQLGNSGVMGYFYTFLCLLTNIVLCNPILLAIVVFVVIGAYVFMRMRSKWGF